MRILCSTQMENLLYMLTTHCMGHTLHRNSHHKSHIHMLTKHTASDLIQTHTGTLVQQQSIKLHLTHTTTIQTYSFTLDIMHQTVTGIQEQLCHTILFNHFQNCGQYLRYVHVHCTPPFCIILYHVSVSWVTTAIRSLNSDCITAYKSSSIPLQFLPPHPSFLSYPRPLPPTWSVVLWVLLLLLFTRELII